MVVKRHRLSVHFRDDPVFSISNVIVPFYVSFSFFVSFGIFFPILQVFFTWKVAIEKHSLSPRLI